MNMQAKTKIVISVFTFIFLVITIMTAISYNNFKTSSETVKKNELEIIAQAVGKAVDVKMGEYFGSLELASKLFNNTAGLSGDALVDLRTNILKNLKANTDTLVAYYALNNGDTFNLKGYIPGFNEKAVKREWFIRIQNGEKRIVTTPYKSLEGDIVMAAGVPLLENGKVAGNINVNLKLSTITDFTNGLLAFDKIILTREDGYIMAHKNNELIGKSLWDVIPDLEQYASKTENGQLDFEFENELYDASLFNIEGLKWKVWVFENDSIITADSTENLYTSIAQAVVALILSAVMVNLLTNVLVFKPMRSMTTAMDGLANGNLETTVPALDQQDEIGEMAQSVQVFKDNAQRVKHLEAEQVAQAKAAEEQRRQEMHNTADKFEAEVQGIVGIVNSASDELRDLGFQYVRCGRKRWCSL